MRKHLRSTRIHIPTIELVIDFGDGARKVFAIEWRRGMTPLQSLVRAGERSHGVVVAITGSDALAFITEIDGVANDMTGQVAQNWMYTVNGHMAKVGCGQCELKPSDIVRWEYTIFDKDATL
jgi:hypothetical protein